MSMRNDWTDIAISWPVAMLILVIGAWAVVREARTERAPYVNPDAICRNAALDRMAKTLGESIALKAEKWSGDQAERDQKIADLRKAIADTTRMGCGL